VNVFNNVILARNRQLPDGDRMIETCRSIFKSFNTSINNLSVCIGWCTDQIKMDVGELECNALYLDLSSSGQGLVAGSYERGEETLVP